LSELSVSIMLSGNGEIRSGRVPEVASTVEKNGFTGLWFGETTLRDASILTTIAACATKKIQLGTSIMNVYTRSPSQLALIGTTLNEFCEGRFTLGLGVSTAAIIESWHGIKFENAMGRLEETVKMLRKYFSGEKFSMHGRYSSPSNARLRGGLSPKIALAALNDQMIRKAAVLSDRIILNLYPTERISHAIELIDQACRAAGRGGRPLLSVMLYSYLLGDDEKGLDAAKDLISFYASAPAYSAMFSSIGFPSEARAMLEGWKNKDREAVRKSVTRQMIDQMIVLGSMGDLRERIRKYHEAGVDDVLISPSPFGDYQGNVNKAITEYF
jgi:probable F420-dependent oxidoreductase